MRFNQLLLGGIVATIDRAITTSVTSLSDKVSKTQVIAC